jgi:hypothetical protein
MAKTQPGIKAKDGGDNLKVARDLLSIHIPHLYGIAATIGHGTMSVKADRVVLKHLGGQDYLLTFE